MSLKLIHSTPNGQVFQCPGKVIHLEFRNIAIRLTLNEFRLLADTINDIEPEKLEKMNQTSQYKRKIQLPVGSPKYLMVFTTEEFLEFRQLINSVLPYLQISRLGVDRDCFLN